MRSRWGVVAALLVLLAACTAVPEPEDRASPAPNPVSSPATSGTPSPEPSSPETATSAETRTGPDGRPFVIEEIAEFDEPWAMTFLPDGRSLITGRAGELTLRGANGQNVEVSGVPEVVHEGQGGFGDVVLAPDFETSKTVYVSWAEAGDGGDSGAAVGRATLTENGGSAELADLDVIWRQEPKVSGNGHYGHRLAFSPDGRHLFVSSGERQKMEPAQDLDSDLGKIIRMSPDGSGAQVWTYGHRNPLGIAFDADGNLWNSEMGPQGGDEVNLVKEGANYGWPEASNGSHYSGEDIPDHAAGDGFEAPKAWWNPSISPGSLMIYDGAMFPQWQGDAFVGALSGEALIRVDLDGTDAAEGDQWDLGRRVREVEQAPDGAIWLLTDEGQVLRLVAP